MQPSGALKEGDAQIIVNQLFKNFNQLPNLINLGNIVVHDQSQLMVWMIDFSAHRWKESMVERSIA